MLLRKYSFPSINSYNQNLNKGSSYEWGKLLPFPWRKMEIIDHRTVEWFGLEGTS